MNTRKRSGSSSSGMGVDLTLSHYSQSQQASQGVEDTTNSVIYFLMPIGLTEETCSKALMAAYRVCQDFDLNAKIIPEEEVRALKPKPGNVFVVDPFQGSGFHYLEQQFHKLKKFLVIGPQCIQYAMQQPDNGSIQSKGYPFYIMSMRNICVTLSGFKDKDEQRELTELVQLMNGIVSKPLSAATTHVVAKNVITEKCYQAFQDEVPVMTADWIRAVWKEGQERIIDATDAKYIKYACGIFYNVNVCVSQVPSNLKNTIERIIVAGGGYYSKNFTRHKTDVLIVPHAGGDKYKYALEWKVPVVTPEWVDKSKEAGHVLPFDNFKPSERNLLSSTQISGVDPRMPNFEGLSVLSAIGDITDRTNLNDTDRLTNATILTNMDKEEVRKEDIELIMGADTFLDGCTIYLCNYENEKLNKLRMALNASGAFRPNNLSDSVTHIVVINDLISEKEVKAIKALGSMIPIVSMSWLLECARQRSVVDADPYAISLSKYDKDVTNTQPHGRTSDKVSRHGSQRTAENLEQASTRNSKRSSADKSEKNVGVFQAPERVERIRSTQKNEEEPMALVSAEESEVTTGTTVDGNIFLTGLVFMVKLESTEETKRISSLIRTGGGEIAADNHTGSDAIAILPPVYQPLSFKPINIFTKYWVEEICDAQSLEIPESAHHTAFEADENLKNLLSGVVLATSAYASQIKEYIAIVAPHLGAVVQETFCRKNKDKILRTTHLLCNVTDNDKFRAAQRWGTPVVLCEWITECFKQKKRLDHSDFLLLPDSDSTSSVMMKTPKGDKHWKPKDSVMSVIPGTAPRVLNPVPKAKARPEVQSEPGTNAFKTPVPFKKVALPVEPPPESPLVREGMTREASRQLKRALDFAAEDSFDSGKNDSGSEAGDRRIAQPRKSTPLRKIMDSVDDILIKRAAQRRVELGLPAKRSSPEQQPQPETSGDGEESKNGGANDSGMDQHPDDDDEAELGIRRSKRVKVANSPIKRATGSTGSNSTGYSTLPGSRKGSTASNNGAAHRISPSQANKFGNMLDDMVAAGGEEENPKEESQIHWNADPEDEAPKAPSPEPEPEPEKEATPPRVIPASERKPEEKGFIKQRRGTASASRATGSGKPPSAVKSASNKKASGTSKKATQAAKKQQKALCFAISGGTATEKERYREILTVLGATVSSADCYDAATDAVIATKVARSEKILGSIAAGKAILHPTYLDACEAQGKFVEFDDYLWSEEFASTDAEKNMTRVAQHWYRRLKENPADTPYSRFAVCLCEEKPAKIAAYTRLIEAGGGRVVPEDDPELNIVIGEGREATRISAERKVPLKIPMFLNDVIITFDDQRVNIL